MMAGFAGIDQLHTLDADLGMLQRLTGLLLALADPEVLRRNAEQIKAAHEAALAAVASATEAQRALEEARSALDARKDQLDQVALSQAKMDAELSAREKLVTEREQKWKAAVARTLTVIDGNEAA